MKLIEAFQGKSKPTMYLASPLFNSAEKHFNTILAELLAPYCTVYLPQRDGGLMADFVSQGIAPSIAAEKVFEADVKAMGSCDFLLAVLDGRTVDEGVAFEIGYVFSIGKRCYGLQTDVRRALPTGNNPMIERSLTHIFEKLPDLVDWARRALPLEVVTFS